MMMKTVMAIPGMNTVRTGMPMSVIMVKKMAADSGKAVTIGRHIRMISMPKKVMPMISMQTDSMLKKVMQRINMLTDAMLKKATAMKTMMTVIRITVMQRKTVRMMVM